MTTDRPIKTIEVGGDEYVVSLLTRAQVKRIAEAVVTEILDSNLDVVLADRIRTRMHELDELEHQKALESEHRRYAPGFGHE